MTVLRGRRVRVPERRQDILALTPFALRAAWLHTKTGSRQPAADGAQRRASVSISTCGIVTIPARSDRSSPFSQLALVLLATPLIRLHCLTVIPRSGSIFTVGGFVTIAVYSCYARALRIAGVTPTNHCALTEVSLACHFPVAGARGRAAHRHVLWIVGHRNDRNSRREDCKKETDAGPHLQYFLPDMSPGRATLVAAPQIE